MIEPWLPPWGHRSLWNHRFQFPCRFHNQWLLKGHLLYCVGPQRLAWHWKGIFISAVTDLDTMGRKPRLRTVFRWKIFKNSPARVEFWLSERSADDFDVPPLGTTEKHLKWITLATHGKSQQGANMWLHQMLVRRAWTTRGHPKRVTKA